MSASMSLPFVSLEEQPFIPLRHACTHDSQDLVLRLRIDDDQHPSLGLSDGDEAILLVRMGLFLDLQAVRTAREHLCRFPERNTMLLKEVTRSPMIHCASVVLVGHPEYVAILRE